MGATVHTLKPHRSGTTWRGFKAWLWNVTQQADMPVSAATFTVVNESGVALAAWTLGDGILVETEGSPEPDYPAETCLHITGPSGYLTLPAGNQRYHLVITDDATEKFARMEGEWLILPPVPAVVTP
jgi:hypothetical protein